MSWRLWAKVIRLTLKWIGQSWNVRKWGYPTRCWSRLVNFERLTFERLHEGWNLW